MPAPSLWRIKPDPSQTGAFRVIAEFIATFSEDTCLMPPRRTPQIADIQREPLRARESGMYIPFGSLRSFPQGVRSRRIRIIVEKPRCKFSKTGFLAMHRRWNAF